MKPVDRDRVIDEVAKRLTHAEPPADLRARVLTRIQARAPFWRKWQLVPAGALVAMGVVTAVVITRWHPAVPADARPIAAPAPVIASATPAVTEPVLQTERTTSRRAAAVPELTAEERAWNERAIPALERQTELTLNPLAPASVNIPELRVEGVTVTPLGSGSKF